ncbi:palmitoyltransferase ZDHHC13-like isoform 3-T3 [Geothlypis trichas]
MHRSHSVHEDKGLPDPYPVTEDPSTCDIVKATQYGMLERCKELVEAGYDVRQPDKENVTLLHWAAINNRQELVKYYISKGAVVDQLGGDLNSTPLHWATRQGHLLMVVLLLKCGADPSLIDGEGFSSIHLAVLFQHMPIISYLIAKGQSIDTAAFNGQTPLMLTAQKAIGPEPMKFLLKLNPSLNAVDNVQKNTALHWAVASGNTSAVDLLLEAGASLDIKNVKGERPLDIAYQSQNHLMVYMLQEEEKMRNRRNNRLLKLVEKYELFLMLASSLTLMWAIGYVMDLSSDSWLLKGGLLLSLLFVMSLFVRQLVGLKNLRYLPTAFLLSSVFWMSMTWFFWFLPDATHTNIILKITVVFSMMGLLYYFYKTWSTDPGYIKTSEEESKENIIALAEAGCLDLRTFCTSCLVRKPLRSVHCLACQACVARFDQHSLWTGQCIGIGNHCYYLLFLFFLTMTCVCLLYGTLQYWCEHCAANFLQDGAWTSFTQTVSCSPWVSYISSVACLHTLWASVGLTVQLYQIVFLGLTSHERMNLLAQRKSSKHPVSLRRTPYKFALLGYENGQGCDGREQCNQKRELFPTASVIADVSHIAKKRRGQLYSGI